MPLFQDWDIFLILGEEDLETPVEKESSVQKSFKKWKHRHYTHTLHRVLYETLKYLSGLTFIVRILPCSSSLLIIVKYVPRWPRFVIKEGVRENQK